MEIVHLNLLQSLQRKMIKQRRKKRKSTTRSRTRSVRRSRTRSRTRSARRALKAQPAAPEVDVEVKKPPKMDQEKLKKLEEKVRLTKEQIRAKEEMQKKKNNEAAEKEADEKEDDDEAQREWEKDAKPYPQKDCQQCPVCFKYLKSASDFALSQHLWCVHPDHPEAAKRSAAYKVVLKEKERDKQGSWSGKKWPADNRQKSQSRERSSNRWKGWRDDSREPSQPRSSRGRSHTQQERDTRRSSSRVSEHSRSSGSRQNQDMLAEFFKTTRQLSRRS